MASSTVNTVYFLRCLGLPMSTASNPGSRWVMVPPPEGNKKLIGDALHAIDHGKAPMDEAIIEMETRG